MIDRTRRVEESQTGDRTEAGTPTGIQDGRDFALALTALRLAAGLSIREIARRTSVPAATLGGYFSGRHLPVRPDALLPVLQACDAASETHADWIAALNRARRIPGPRPETSVQPYRGLDSYRADDSARFFGREGLTGRLAERVAQTWTVNRERRMVVVTGASGCGKSSLLHAGLIPTLSVSASSFTPGPHPLMSLAQVIAELTGNPVHAVTKILRQRPEDCGALLSEVGELLFVIDQFEELFASDVPAQERDLFLSALGAGLSEGPSRAITAVLGLRSDFFAKAALEPQLQDALQHEQFLVNAMSEDELRRAIVEPARQCGVTVDDELVATVLDDMTVTRGARATFDAGALPLMSHALMVAWQSSRRGRLTVAEYRGAGGLSGAAQQTAETLYTELSVSQQVIVRQIFSRLSSGEVGDPLTRRRATRAELRGLAEHDSEVAEILDRFTASRLITSHDGDIEISHESLFTAWPRLAGWIETDRLVLRRLRRLTVDAQQWNESDRDEDWLLRGLRLVELLEWLRAQPDRWAYLNGVERTYLRTSEQSELRRQQEGRRRMRRTRRLLAAVSSLTVLACLLTGVAWVQRSNAVRSTHDLRQARDAALSRALAGVAERMQSSDPALAAQLALSSYRQSPTAEARSAVLDAAGTARPARLGMAPGQTALAVSADGSQLALGDARSGAVRLYRFSTPEAPVPAPAGNLPGQPGNTLFAVAFSPKGTLLATGGQDSALRLWDVADPRSPRLLADQPSGVRHAVESIRFSPDGQQLAIAGGGPAIFIWDVASPGHPRRGTVLRTAASEILGLSFAPNGRTLAAVGSAGTLDRWQIAGTHRDSFRPLAPVGDPPSSVTDLDAVAFSPNSQLLAVGSKNDTVRIWRLNSRESARPLMTLTEFTSWVDAIEFSADGSQLAAGSSDNNLAVWSTTDWHRLALLPHPGPVTGLAFGPRQRSLVSASSDGSASIWPWPGAVLPAARDAQFSAGYGKNGVFTVGSAEADGTVTLWRAERTAQAPSVYLSRVSTPDSAHPLDGASAVSADGTLLAAGTLNGSVYLWDISDPVHPHQLGRRLPGLSRTVESIAFTPDSRFLAAGSDDAVIQLWNIGEPATATPVARLAGLGSYIYNIAISGDGRRLAAADVDGSVWLWDISNPAKPRTLARNIAFEGSAYSVALSAKGDLLAAGSAHDHVLKVWHVGVDGTLVPFGDPVPVPSSSVFGMTFSPDSSLLAAGFKDGTVRTWQVGHVDRPVASTTLYATGSSVYATVFSPDGSELSATGTGRSVHTWPSDVDDAISLICRTSGDGITRAEWATYVPDRPYAPPCQKQR